MFLFILLEFNKLYRVLYNRYKKSLYLRKEEGVIIGEYSI
jgi:hypothetical protein